jgi:hypothetical protein
MVKLQGFVDIRVIVAILALFLKNYLTIQDCLSTESSVLKVKFHSLYVVKLIIDNSHHSLKRVLNLKDGKISMHIYGWSL